MTDDKRHVVDLYADAKAADADYRAAEQRKKNALDLPYLVTLNFRTREEAHEFIESIKAHGGVLVEAAGMHTRTLHAGVMDFHEWGGETEVFGPKWPNHPDRPEV